MKIDRKAADDFYRNVHNSRDRNSGRHVGEDNLFVAHSTSAYPCPLEELNLRMIQTLLKRYPSVPIGYSGHETGLMPTCAAVTLGACFVERHITLDRAMWGTDQAASVELNRLQRMVNYIRDIERLWGMGSNASTPRKWELGKSFAVFRTRNVS